MWNHTGLRRLGRWTGAACLLLLAATAARADEPTEGPSLKVEGPTVTVEAATVQLSDYWIGVQCGAVPPPLRAQLGLAEAQGLLVGHVVPDSPAAKAGIKQYDVLLKASDKPLGKVQDLVDAVDAAKDKPFAVELLRAGKTEKITLQPAKRPDDAGAGQLVPMPGVPGDPDFDTVRKWFERMRPGAEGKPPMRFRFFHPGTILPPGADVPPGADESAEAKPAPAMPGNMSVAITKSGDKPAKIVVTQNGKKWEVTEDELDKLPEEIRPHVQRMLGHVPLGAGAHMHSFNFDLVPEWATPPKAAGRLEKRMEEMNRRIEQLRKSIDEMREKRSQKKAEAEKSDAA